MSIEQEQELLNSDQVFKEIWEATKCQYGFDALENVKYGFDLAMKHNEQQGTIDRLIMGYTATLDSGNKENEMNSSPNPLTVMIIETISDPGIITMLVIRLLYPDIIEDMGKHLRVTMKNDEPPNDGDAYDYLQSRIGGLKRNESMEYSNECFRSLLIATLKKALAEGGENA